MLYRKQLKAIGTLESVRARARVVRLDESLVKSNRTPIIAFVVDPLARQ